MLNVRGKLKAVYEFRKRNTGVQKYWSLGILEIKNTEDQEYFFYCSMYSIKWYASASLIVIDTAVVLGYISFSYYHHLYVV